MSSQCFSFVQKVMHSFKAAAGLEARLLEKLTLQSAHPGRLTLSLPLEPQHLNRLGTLHGGTIASLTDTCGSLVVASHGLWHTGVSTDLNVTFMRSGGASGEGVSCEVVCDRIGRSMAFTSVRFLNDKKQVFARGSHTKYIANAWGDERNLARDVGQILRE